MHSTRTLRQALRRLFVALLPATLALLGVQAHAADAADQLALGKKLFTQAVPACAVCHTLKDAGSEGAVGPVLDELKPDAARVVNALRNGLGNMPSYKDTLSEDQMQALARYVAKASGSAQ